MGWVSGRVEVIAALRRLRMTGAEIAECLDMAVSTVSGILTRIGLGKLGRIGLEPAQRYERARPGELIHIDVKKLGRIHEGVGHRFAGRPGQRKAAGTRTDGDGVRRKRVGWEYVHIAIDDATRLAYVEVLSDEKAVTAIRFLHRAVAHFSTYGITTERLITDNGSAYRSTVHAIACRASRSAVRARVLADGLCYWTARRHGSDELVGLGGARRHRDRTWNLSYRIPPPSREGASDRSARLPRGSGDSVERVTGHAGARGANRGRHVSHAARGWRHHRRMS
jgi:Integrase core domain